MTEIPDDLVKELSDSEKKLKVLYDRRDHFNEEAKVIREMRDDLHGKRKAILDQIADIRDRKEELHSQIKECKARRDLYNEKARLLRGDRRRSIGDSGGENPYEDIHTLELDLQKLENTYQTVPAGDLAKERKLVAQIEEKRKKLKDLNARIPGFQSMEAEIKKVEEEVSDFKVLADSEHIKMQELYGKVKEVEKQLDEYYPTIKHLRSEADKKHEEYIKVREKADSYHQKAMELRERVLSMRQERNKLVKDARAVVDEQNKRVSAALEDEDALDSAAEEAVDVLLKKGKITL